MDFTKFGSGVEKISTNYMNLPPILIIEFRVFQTLRFLQNTENTAELEPAGLTFNVLGRCIARDGFDFGFVTDPILNLYTITKFSENKLLSFECV